jgi:hypothetical protein
MFLSEEKALTAIFPLPLRAVVAGFVLLGASYEKKLPVVGLIFGWGMAESVPLLFGRSPCAPRIG